MSDRPDTNEIMNIDAQNPETEARLSSGEGLSLPSSAPAEASAKENITKADEMTVHRTLPVIALRGLSLFPGTSATFELERTASLEAVSFSSHSDRIIFLAAQKDPSLEIPEEKDLYGVGMVGRIRQQLTAPGGGMCRIMVEGLCRARVIQYTYNGKSWYAEVIELKEQPEKITDIRASAILRSLVEHYYDYIQQSTEYSPQAIVELLQFRTDTATIDAIAQSVYCTVEEKQALLEELRPYRRAEQLIRIIARETEILKIENKINTTAKESMDRTQREYYLREEMKAIQDELAEEGFEEDEDYTARIKKLNCTEEIKKKLYKEVGHLKKEPSGSADASVLRTYLDTCLEIPWGKLNRETVSVAKARSILEHDHYGLEKVKERILEYLAVRQLSPEIKGGLLCLVGPPGTGKTSVAMSIARATNRKLVRISLGGVHDEADIRGHRKTYVGSMPGRIVNGLIQAGSMNPLMVLDEIDKLGSDYKGDPASALLEVFDAEQNSSFRDHYLELPLDLSNIFFITTANTTETIPPALLDRMEVIELPSYTDEEKVRIAKKYLLPKQRKKHGLSAAQLKVSDAAFREIIASYTKESGVRVLEREIARLCRKTASGIAEEKFSSLSLDPGSVSEILGPVKIKKDEFRSLDQVGLVRGLAWTTAGGEVLDVEVAALDGTGKIEITGNLGQVMTESVKAAVTCIRARAAALGIDPEFYKNKDLHIHFPEGAVPKDGPSAGVTICTAIASALSGRPVRHDIAMTGEITLRGRVLAIGGLREKTMGALRVGVKTVILPDSNRSDLDEIDPLVREKLTFIPASDVDTVLENAIPGIFAGPVEQIPAAKAPSSAASVILNNHDRPVVRQ